MNDTPWFITGIGALMVFIMAVGGGAIAFNWYRQSKKAKPSNLPESGPFLRWMINIHRSLIVATVLLVIVGLIFQALVWIWIAGACLLAMLVVAQVIRLAKIKRALTNRPTEHRDDAII